MTRAEATDVLLSLARAAGRETDDGAAVARLLERISETDEPHMLRSLLAEAGAAALVREARALEVGR